MKIAYERFCMFLKETVCDFANIDADIHPALVQKFNLPPLGQAPMLTEGLQARSLEQPTSRILELFSNARMLKKNISFE